MSHNPENGRTRRRGQGCR